MAARAIRSRHCTDCKALLAECQSRNAAFTRSVSAFREMLNSGTPDNVEAARACMMDARELLRKGKLAYEGHRALHHRDDPV